jgi:hypothetical protein
MLQAGRIIGIVLLVAIILVAIFTVTILLFKVVVFMLLVIACIIPVVFGYGIHKLVRWIKKK